jgi:hypothetical protein
MIAALAVSLLSVAGQATAASVTYDFTQTGFTDSNGVAGTLTGSFTANPESGGNITVADLTSFQATFQETYGGVPQNFVFNLDNVNDFSFNAGVPGSFGFSAGAVSEGIVLCSGSTDVNQVCYGFTSPLSPRSSSKGFFEDLPDFPTSLTPNIAEVTQVGDPSAATPEPDTLTMFAGAGLLLIGAGRIKYRRTTTEPRV